MIPPAEVIIDQVRDHRYDPRDLDDIRGLMIHRCGVNRKTGVVIGYDAIAIADAFCGRDERWESVARATGNHNPYTFYIGGDRGHNDLHGKVWQALELCEIGHHARKLSRSHLAIGLIGDFRVDPPGANQWGAAVSLCADLCLMLSITPARVIGHGEHSAAHGGDKAPGQQAACPGARFVMLAFRQALSRMMAKRVRRDAIWRLQDTGYRVA